MNLWNRHIHSDMENVHKCSYAYRNPKNTKLVQVQNFLLPFLSLRFFDMRRERHSFFLCWLFHLTPPCAAPPPQTTGLASTSSENRLALSSVETYCFFQIPKSSGLLGITSFTSLVPFPIWGFYCDISDCHIHPARVWTLALNVCT